MDFLVAWIQQPHHAPRQALADAVWLLVASQPGRDHDRAPRRARRELRPRQRLLRGDDVADGRGLDARRCGGGRVMLGVLTVVDAQHGVPVETVVALDDRDAAVAVGDHAASWRRWLQMAMPSPEREHPVTLSQHVAGRCSRRVDAAAVRGRCGVAGPLGEVVAGVGAAARTQVELGVARRARGGAGGGGCRCPDLRCGGRGRDPRGLRLAGRRRSSWSSTSTRDTGKDLADDGWRVVDPDVDAIVEALQRTRGSPLMSVIITKSVSKLEPALRDEGVRVPREAQRGPDAARAAHRADQEQRRQPRADGPGRPGLPRGALPADDAEERRLRAARHLAARRRDRRRQEGAAHAQPDLRRARDHRERRAGGAEPSPDASRPAVAPPAAGGDEPPTARRRTATGSRT